MISIQDYCSRICGGKCCVTNGDNVRCPNLTDKNTCSIYKQRFKEPAKDTVLIGWYKSNIKLKPLICTKIKILISKKQLPQAIEEQCCIAHPELLKREYVL